MTNAIKPGTPCPTSGQYGVVGPRGGDRGREITSTRGNPMPPARTPGERYVLIDPTKHQK